MKDTYRRSDQRSKFIGKSSVAPDLNELGKLLANLSTEDRLLSRSMLCFKLRYSISPCPSLQTKMRQTYSAIFQESVMTRPSSSTIVGTVTAEFLVVSASSPRI